MCRDCGLRRPPPRGGTTRSSECPNSAAGAATAPLPRRGRVPGHHRSSSISSALPRRELSNVTVVGRREASIYGWRALRSTTSARVFPAGACPSLTTRRSYQGILDARRTSSAAILTLQLNQSWLPPAAHLLPSYGRCAGGGGGLPSVWLWRRTRAPRPLRGGKPSPAACQRPRVSEIASFPTRSHAPREFEDRAAPAGHPLRDQRRLGLFRPPGDKGCARPAPADREPDGRRRAGAHPPGPNRQAAGRWHVSVGVSQLCAAGHEASRLLRGIERDGFPEMAPKVASLAVSLVEITDRIAASATHSPSPTFSSPTRGERISALGELRAQRDGKPARSAQLRKVFSSPAGSSATLPWQGSGILYATSTGHRRRAPRR